ncbi:MAG: hypothetical protein ACRDQ5_22565 [Sciscionella sp.]
MKDPTRFYYSTLCQPKTKGDCGGGVNIPGQETDEWITAAVIRKYELEAERRYATIEPEP